MRLRLRVSDRADLPTVGLVSQQHSQFLTETGFIIYPIDPE